VDFSVGKWKISYKMASKSSKNSVEVNSNTIRIFIAWPWLRDVPEGISCGTWGQKDPAGSRLASDSAPPKLLPHYYFTSVLNQLDVILT
jgi:hypothetical protein